MLHVHNNIDVANINNYKCNYVCEAKLRLAKCLHVYCQYLLLWKTGGGGLCVTYVQVNWMVCEVD